ncbi:hypothetical protein T484DRAFT_1756555 [Baffinella frigidus]|nr:hypothetical protein T484DRAFT_1756555 [Cryptophyta sp. CCMP2293]
MSDTVNTANTAMRRTMADTTATLVVDDSALQAPGSDDTITALPAVMSWALAPRTAKMDREIKAILARVHAETDAAIAAEEAEVHETCLTCNHTKTFTKVVNATGETELVVKTDVAAAAAGGGQHTRKSSRRPLGFGLKKGAKKSAKKGAKKSAKKGPKRG